MYRKYLIILISIFLVSVGVFFSGCREDIQMVRPGDPIPVVYGVFDINQSTHYLKLSKSFAGEDDPFTLAKDPDQIFFSQAKVFLSIQSGTGLGDFKKSTDVTRLEGLFPISPNEVYVLNRKLDPGDYQITIIPQPGADTLTATFSFIQSFRIITPKSGFRRVYFYEDPMLFTWIAGPDAGLFEICFTLEFEEWLKNGQMEVHSVDFTRQLHPQDLESENGRLNYRLFSDSFYSKLSTVIRKDPSVDYRKPIDLELKITAADTVVSRYLDWFSLEIDDQINPNGNIKGAIGFVGTKYTIPFTGLVLSQRSQDSLLRGKYTKDLDFVANPDW